MFTSFSVTGCSLELLRMGEKGIVTVCNTQDEKIRKKLIAIGIKTGTIISVEQQFPVFIVNFGSLSMTIDREIARAIYVRVLES
jgi:ferrous iron transport protein A